MLELKTPGSDLKYHVLGRVFRAALLLCRGSADEEQGFSRSAELMTRMQARTVEQTLNAKVFVADVLYNYENKAELVPITKKLLCLARSARPSHELYLIGRKQDWFEKE